MTQETYNTMKKTYTKSRTVNANDYLRKCAEAEWPNAQIDMPYMPNPHEEITILEEVDPRDVPEGVAPLPEPWLAFLYEPILVEGAGKSPYWNHYEGEWKKEHTCEKRSFGFVHAIDVRTDFAKEHYPEIVDCYRDEPFMQPEPQVDQENQSQKQGSICDEFDEWWGDITERLGDCGVMGLGFRVACEKAFKAGQASKEA